VKPVTRYALVLMLIMGVPFFFLGGPGSLASRSFKSLWDLGHILFFTLASVGLCDFFVTRRDNLSASRSFWRVFVIVFCTGLGVELLQGFSSGRSPSFFDLLRNQLGVLIGFTVYFSWNKKLSRRTARGLQGAVFLLLLLSLGPAFRAVIDEREAVRQFPVLADFETRFEHRRWNHVHQLKMVPDPVRHGNSAMRVQLSTQKYSGTGLLYFPHDWSDYKFLHFSVLKQDNAQMSLYVKVHDFMHSKHEWAYGDRFNTTFEVEYGWNDFQIFLDEVRHAPTDREMDMHKIESFAIFVISQKQPRVIFLDYVYLSN